MHIEREQRKKNNNESSLLQKIKKLENQLKQKDKLISKISNKNNFNNIKRIKIISFFIRNRNNNFRNNYFKNLKIRTAENIRLFPEIISLSKRKISLYDLATHISSQNAYLSNCIC